MVFTQGPSVHLSCLFQAGWGGKLVSCSSRFLRPGRCRKTFRWAGIANGSFSICARTLRSSDRRHGASHGGRLRLAYPQRVADHLHSFNSRYVKRDIMSGFGSSVSAEMLAPAGTICSVFFLLSQCFDSGSGDWDAPFLSEMTCVLEFHQVRSVTNYPTQVFHGGQAQDRILHADRQQ